MTKNVSQECSITVIAFVDKEWPPQHSFIDGMLAGALADLDSIKVYVVVSGAKSEKAIYRHFGAVGFVKLHRRLGVSRFTNGIRALRLGWSLCARAKRQRRLPVLFVRNDPVYLFAASLLRAIGLSRRLVFQSSFPHEQLSEQWLKRCIAVALYKAGSRHVDAISAVSPVGLRRVTDIFPSATTREWIPLLSDMGTPVVSRDRLNHESELQFVYIGTHHPSRSLSIVFEGIRLASKAGVLCSFRFIGGSPEDVERLRSRSCLLELESDGIVKIVDRLPRAQIPDVLAQADIGLSLIPPRREFQELSPTKLVEYMGAGLACLASRGIPLQEKFSEESGGALLINFDAEAICDAILQLSGDRDRVRKMQENARKYAAARLQYGRYLPQMLKLLNARA